MKKIQKNIRIDENVHCNAQPTNVLENEKS